MRRHWSSTRLRAKRDAPAPFERSGSVLNRRASLSAASPLFVAATGYLGRKLTRAHAATVPVRKLRFQSVSGWRFAPPCCAGQSDREGRRKRRHPLGRRSQGLTGKPCAELRLQVEASQNHLASPLPTRQALRHAKAPSSHVLQARPARKRPEQMQYNAWPCQGAT